MNKKRIIIICICVILLILLIGFVFLHNNSSNNEIEYKVQFDSNGGTSISTQMVKKGELVLEPENPE